MKIHEALGIEPFDFDLYFGNRFKFVDRFAGDESLLPAMSKRDLQVIRLRVCEGMTYREIAERVDVSRERVRDIVHKQLRLLNRRVSICGERLQDIPQEMIGVLLATSITGESHGRKFTFGRRKHYDPLGLYFVERWITSFELWKEHPAGLIVTARGERPIDDTRWFIDYM